MKQRELNAALFALVLSVSRSPSVRAEIDAGLPEDSKTAAVLAEINGMVQAGAVNVERTVMTAPKAKARVKSARGTLSVEIEPRPCKECSAVFAPVVSNGLYCSEECRKKSARKRATQQKADTRPQCRACSSRFTPTGNASAYCEACRKSGVSKLHAARVYQQRRAEQERAQGKRVKVEEQVPMVCERCGTIEPRRPCCTHKKYCASCRIVVDNEYKRAYDKKRAAIYKAAVAMGVCG